MAARTLRPRHSDEIRAKIQASQLVNRLTDHVLNGTDMSATQVNAAKILLAKAVPDLKALEHDLHTTGGVHFTLYVPPKDANA